MEVEVHMVNYIVNVVRILSYRPILHMMLSGNWQVYKGRLVYV